MLCTNVRVACRFNIYVFINTLIILLGLLDLGLSSAFIKYLSHYRYLGHTDRIKDLVHSNNSLFFLIGLIGFLVLIAAGWLAKSLLPFVNFPGNYFLEIFGLAGLMFFINTAATVFMIAPRALERYDVSTKIDLALLIVSNLLTLVLLLSGQRLLGILAGQTIIAFAFAFVYYLNSRKILPQAGLKFAWVREEIINCYRFGLKTFVASLAGSSLNYLDRLLIPFYLGPAALTYYSLPGNVTSHIPGVSNSLTAVLFPMISGLNSLNDREKIKKIYIQSIRLVTIIVFAITASIMLFAYKIMLYWLGLDFAVNSTNIMIVLALTHFLIALSKPLTSILLGLDKTKFLALSSLAMAALNLILIFILLPLGISGIAWAFLLSVLPIIYMFYHVEKKFLGLAGRFKAYLLLYGKNLATAIIFIPLIHYLFLPLTVNVFILIVAGPAAVLLYLLLYKILGFVEKEDWLVLQNFYRPIVKQFLKR